MRLESGPGRRMPRRRPESRVRCADCFSPEKRPFLLLSTTRKQGSIALRRGTYNAVRVATRGAWRIQLGTAK